MAIAFYKEYLLIDKSTNSCRKSLALVIPTEANSIGIDVELDRFAFLSTGEQIDCPKYPQEAEGDVLQRAHHRLQF